MDGVAAISDYQAKVLLDGRCNRLQVIFDPDETIPLAAVGKMARINQITDNWNMDKTVQWINKTWS